jgi:hypothetical protein
VSVNRDIWNFAFGLKLEKNRLRRYVQGDSLAREPTEVYLQIFNEFVNQLMVDELTTGYYQQDSATCHTSNASMREIESFFLKTELSQKTLWPLKSPDLTPADFFLWGLLKSQETEAVSVDTLGIVFQNLEKRIKVCLGVKGNRFQRRL